nr:hypothetical protein Iba_chr06eCG2460 [Ipomoea batatas]
MIRNITTGKSSWERAKHTELGEEKQEHNDGGDEGDNTAGESTVVEILIDCGSPDSAKGRRRRGERQRREGQYGTWCGVGLGI